MNILHQLISCDSFTPSGSKRKQMWHWN